MTDIQPFRVVEVLERAKELERQGQRVVHFEVGEPDFETAAPILAAGQRALAEGATKYTQALGIPALRSRIAEHYASLGLEIEPERVVVTTGASAGLLLLAGLLINAGDEWLLPDPGYPCNEVFVRLVGGQTRALPVTAEQQFLPSPEGLAAAWGVQTRGLLLASPANPTGAMLPAAQLAGLAKQTRDLGGICVLDEIYQGLTYGDLDASRHAGAGIDADLNYPSGLAVDDGLYIINSFSKYFGMTGWRLGWLVLPPGASSAIAPLVQNLFISPPAVSQYAALAAFSPEALAIHETRREAFAKRRDRLFDGLTELGFGLGQRPAGAFYLYAGINTLGLEMDSLTFAQRLLEEYQVAVTPGLDFGSHGAQDHVRFAYTTDMQSIELGLSRLADALANFKAEAKVQNV